MIRWIERADAYRLSVNRMEDGLASAMLGLGLVLIGLSERSCSAWLIVAPVFLVRAMVLLSQRAWVDVPLRGGLLRWQGRWMDAPCEPVAVSRFDVEVAPSRSPRFTRFVLVAILQDGRHIHPFGGTSAGDPRIIDRIEKQLNEALGISPEEERRSAAPEIIAAWRGSAWSATWTPIVAVVILWR
ncbi:MAG: hypothetical protein AAB434_02590 [Planctomycetota bacterium]